MSNNNESSKSGGITFLGILFIVFLVLKLTGHIDWSWWWVFAPLWVMPLLAIIVFIGSIIVYMIKDN